MGKRVLVIRLTPDMATKPARRMWRYCFVLNTRGDLCSYRQFTLATVKKTFDLTTSEEAEIFASMPAIKGIADKVRNWLTGELTS